MKKAPSVRKILQALYYIQSKAPFDNQSRYNKVYLLKMIFTADRYHLRHYGLLATGDSYFAMKLGPVASATYDILKKSPYNINSAEEVYFSAIKELSENDVLIDPQEEDELSVSFKKALDFALREFGDYDWNTLSNISHCYPEWKKHEENLPGRMPMDIKDFFDDPADENCFIVFGKKDDPFKENKDFLALLKDDYDADSISI
ncbi:MAG: SocA family protein [Chitinispirillales bacterium]|jgi:uncharacterized phage-associated protein|nr:SocA family protein [Chitinispirillales bacterium]